MCCSLVILNYNDKERALNLAEKCSRFECINHIIIVDNCSPDNSFEWLVKNNRLNIDIIQTKKNGGFSYGNNYGAKYIIEKYDPQYILFANTDTIFEENSLKKCLYELKHNKELGLVSMRMKNILGYEERACWKEKNYIQSTLFCLWLYRRKKYNSFEYNLNATKELFKYVDVVRGSFMCFKKQALLDINYFDENTFLYYEEDIISKRLQKAKYKIGILTSEYYIHDHIQNKNFSLLEMKKKLDDSMYYLLKTYYHINFMQKCFTKLVIMYSRFEFKFINALKRG